jgi:hypothetical protein
LYLINKNFHKKDYSFVNWVPNDGATALDAVVDETETVVYSCLIEMPLIKYVVAAAGAAGVFVVD